jgi:hypothetical protein
MLQEGRSMLDDILHLAKESMRFRPLGCGTILILLIAAHPSDFSMRPKIEELLEDCTTDFPMVQWEDSAKWLDAALNGPPSLIAPRPETGACNVM